jgi:hypothetical protein
VDNYLKLNFPVDQKVLNVMSLDAYPKDYGKFPDGRAKEWGLKYHLRERVLTPEFIDFLNSAGIKSPKIAVFKGNPRSSLFIHVDSPSCPLNSWGINFSLTPRRAQSMNWFADSQSTQTLVSCTGRTVDIFENLPMVQSVTMDSVPTLVRADVPHNTTNFSDRSGLICSIRDQYNHSFTWEQAVEFFSKWKS